MSDRPISDNGMLTAIWCSAFLLVFLIVYSSLCYNENIVLYNSPNYNLAKIREQEEMTKRAKVEAVRLIISKGDPLALKALQEFFKPSDIYDKDSITPKVEK